MDFAPSVSPHHLSQTPRALGQNCCRPLICRRAGSELLTLSPDSVPKGSLPVGTLPNATHASPLPAQPASFPFQLQKPQLNQPGMF